jgi:protein SCO1/2
MPKRTHTARTFAGRISRLLLVLACVLVAFPAAAQVADMPRELAHVGVSEHLDKPLPLDTVWREYKAADGSVGTPTTLGALVNGSRPVLFLFAYHSCPTLCSMVLKATGTAIHDMPWTVGKDYDVVVASIDPDDNPDNLQHRRDLMIADYNRPGAAAGFHFLLGDKPTIDRTLAAAGVQVEYDQAQKQWGHPAVIMLLKPNGELARYLYGLEFPPNDVRVGLLEASNGKSISTVEQVILYCYQFDPNGGRYVLVAWKVMRIGGGGIAVLLVGTLAFLWLRERRRALATSSKIPEAAVREPAHSHP